MKKYSITTEIKGYSSNIDDTKINEGYMIDGSQNVLFTDSHTVKIRGGYKLLGQSNNNLYKINGSKRFVTFDGTERNIRTWNGNFEVLIDDNWETVKQNIGTGDVYFSEQDLWGQDAKLAYTVFVNNDSKIMKWNGASAMLDSTTTNTITKSGSETFVESGFEVNGRREIEFAVVKNDDSNGINLSVTLDSGNTYNITVSKQADAYETAKDMADKFNTAIGANTDAVAVSEGNKCFVTAKDDKLITSYTTSDTTYKIIKPDPIKIEKPKIVINGNVYEYTGGWDTTTLTGVTPDPSGEAQDSLIFQDIFTINNTDILDIPDDNKNSIVEILDNQLYIGSSYSRFVYISEIGRIDSFYFSRPHRINGEGARLTLGGVLNAMITGDDTMRIQFGFNEWLETKFTLSADLTSQTLQIKRLDVSANDGVAGKYALSHMKYKSLFLSKDNTVNYISKIENLEKRTTKNISYPIDRYIKKLSNKNVSIFYFRDNIYISFPEESIVLIYDTQRTLWQPPQILSISHFTIIDGKLHGHSSLVPETYELFTSESDNGAPIKAVAKFAYMDGGDRTLLKKINEVYTEGYISDDTLLSMRVLFDINGVSGEMNAKIDGNNNYYVYNSDIESSASLGKTSLGKKGVGTQKEVQPTGKNKFRVFNGVNIGDFYEYTVEYSSNGVNQYWEIIAYGSDIELSSKAPTVNRA